MSVWAASSFAFAQEMGGVAHCSPMTIDPQSPISYIVQKSKARHSCIKPRDSFACKNKLISIKTVEV